MRTFIGDGFCVNVLYLCTLYIYLPNVGHLWLDFANKNLWILLNKLRLFHGAKITASCGMSVEVFVSDLCCLVRRLWDFSLT